MKKIIIIGAGISGLSAGIYGQLNGFKTEIFEKNSTSGGECTGWERKNYHFDGCIHYVYGSKDGTGLNQLWKEVGALNENTDIINTELFYQFEENNKIVKIYKDVNLLEKHLLEFAPEDSKLIVDICNAIRKLHKMEIQVDKPMDMMSLKETIKMFIQMLQLKKIFNKYGRISIKEMAEKFNNPVLRQAFQQQIPTKNSALVMLNVLASMNNGDCGWPIGGSKQFSRRIEEKYKSLGGKIHFKSIVEKIKVENGKAIGIILKNGQEFLCDYIISSADGYFTLQNLLSGKFWDSKLNKLYSDDSCYPIMTSVQVSVGINSDLSKLPDMVYFKYSKSIDAGGFKHDYIGLKHYSYDITIAPEGKSVITVILEADYNWWKEKYKNKVIYNSEKSRIGKEISLAIEEQFPDICGKIEVIDVATPMTYVRYCNAWRGAWMSWMLSPNSKIHFHTGKLKGLKNFFLTGQWTMPPGGLPIALVTGKWTIQRICNEYSIKFQNKIN